LEPRPLAQAKIAGEFREPFFTSFHNKMATCAAILGRGEFCKVVGEGLFTGFFIPVLISLPILAIIYINDKKILKKLISLF
jgi:hypothetical protein